MPSKKNLRASISFRALTAVGVMPALGASVLFASPAAAQIVVPPVVVPPVVLPPVVVIPPVVVDPPVTEICATLPTGLLDCTNNTTGIVDVVASPNPVAVTLGEGFNTAQTVAVSTLAGADIAINSLGDAVITTAGPGLVADSGAGIVANITGVTTSGDGSTGVLLTAVDEVLFDADGTIETVGNGADGVFIEGREVAADLAVVRTIGDDSDGVEITSLNGPIALDADLIETAGDLSTATILNGTGDIALTGRALRTQGTDAVAFDISNDVGACILLGVGGCDNTVQLDEVTTEGFGGVGGLVTAAGGTDINIGLLRTGGDEAAGLNLSTDPAACVVLGTGACGTAFTVDNLSTAGARSPGAVVRGAGPIAANVGVLRTGGDEAAGLDLASDPGACAVLGAGGCDTSFSVGELTTSGAGATGVLVRPAGATTGNVGLLSTQGDDATGVDIASDPALCLLVGAGACDVGFVADSVSTSGDGAAGVLINSAGNIFTDLGLLRTGGDNSTALAIAQNPAACLVLGPGACTVRAAAENVDTDGDNSPGIVVDGGEGPVTVDAGTVDTDGDNSPGVDVTAQGPITIGGGTVTTGGAGSDGINVDGGAGPVLVDVGAVTTTGPDSDGIEVATEAGDITILAGPVRVSGLGSDGVIATSTGCGSIAITARDDIVSTQGTAIVANTACDVSVTTLPGATVSGALAGIDVTSGTGATITIGDAVTSGSGPAIDADGAAATVTIASTGSVAGRVDLTDSADLVTNNGTFAATGTSSFGAGADRFVNNRLFRTAGTAALAGLETFTNNGLIDMVDGAADDQLSLGGDFVGGTGSRLGIDVAYGVNGTPADRLVIAGAASGTTAVSLNLIGTGPAVANPTGVVVVDAGTASAGAFTLAGPTRSGFVDYSFRQAGADTLLVASPNVFAIETLLLGRLGQDFWYQSADAWSESAALRRGNLGSDAPRSAGFWVQGYGGHDESGETRDVDVFGTATSTDLNFETERRGVQGGVDFRAGKAAFGVTGGYQHATSDFASGTGLDLEGHNVGAYLLYGGNSGLYAELLGKVDFFDARPSNGSLFGRSKIDGKSKGAEGEIGYRMTMGGVNVDLNAGLAYVRTTFDPFTASGFTFDADAAESLRGRLGLRVGGAGPGFAPYADVKVFREFEGDNEMLLSSGGFDLRLPDRGVGTWVRGELGLAGAPRSSGGFVAAWGQVGDVKGYGLRLGFRF